jgi:hypothetical protein
MSDRIHGCLVGCLAAEVSSNQGVDADVLGAVTTAIERTVGAVTVTDDADPAVRAAGGQPVDCALEAVERESQSGGCLDGEIRDFIGAAHHAATHSRLLPASEMSPEPLTDVPFPGLVQTPAFRTPPSG